MEKRAVVIALWKQGKYPNEIFNILDKKFYSRQFIKYTIKRYVDSGSINDRKRIGRRCTVRTKKMIKNVRSSINRNPNRSQRKLAKQYKTIKTTMPRILTNDLGYRAF